MGNERDILLGHILTQIEKLNDKHDDIAINNAEAHTEMNKALVEYNSLLAEHIRRTEQLENRTQVLEDVVKPVVDKFEADKTVKKFFTIKFLRISKIIGIIGASAGAIWGIIQIITYLTHIL